MWTWSLNWGKITNDIIIGTCPMTPDDYQRIRDGTAASGVLSLQHDDCLAYWNIDDTTMYHAGTTLGLTMERCPILDFNVPDMRRRLPAAIRMLAAMRARKHRVYVHCTAGMGRAPLVVLGYLTLVENIPPQDAIDLILAGRPGSVPAWEAYYGCRDDLVNRHRHAIELRAYELYEENAHGNAHTDWLQAEAEILRASLMQNLPRNNGAQDQSRERRP